MSTIGGCGLALLGHLGQGDQLPIRVVDNVRKPTLSLFQTGLRFVLRLWPQGQLPRFHWCLPMLTGIHY